MTEARVVVFQSEGEPVGGLLFEPPQAGDGAQPCVIVSPSRVTPAEEMAWIAQPLAAAGYRVLVQGYRKGAVQYQARDVVDVLSAVDFIEAGGSVIVLGHSRGASASLRAAAEDKRITHVVSLSAPTNISRYMRGLESHSPRRYRLLTAAYGGPVHEHTAYYAQISPVTHAARISVPVLLMHGADDMVAPCENSEWMHAELQASGNSSVQILLLEGAGHFFERRFSGYLFEEVRKAVEDWLRIYDADYGYRPAPPVDMY